MRAQENVKGISKIAALFKCYYEINLYGKRDKRINNKNKSSECLRCS